ncbi:MAG: hypothetical protein RSA02_05215 [Bacteroidales bacterium]
MTAYNELYKKAMSRNGGLSANFAGTKKTENMSTLTDKTFKFTIKNTTNKDVCFAVLTGTLKEIREIGRKYPNVDAVLGDGDFFTLDTKTANCKVVGGNSMTHFASYFRHAIGSVKHLEMISSEKQNFHTEIKVIYPEPFSIATEALVDVAQYLEPNQYDQNRLIARNINIPLNPFSMVLMTICANSEVIYTMTCNAQ